MSHRLTDTIPDALRSDVSAISECIRTLRSIRRFLPDEIDRASIEFILHHAVQAGSAKNRQPWRFIVVHDRDVMAALGCWYRTGWQVMARCVDRFPDAYTDSTEHQRQMKESARLATLFEEAPVCIVACYLPAVRNPANFYGGASIYPAVQNLLLAAHALGLGATLTTIQSLDHLADDETAGLTEKLRTILDIPDSAVPAAVIPLGKPAVPFGEVRRYPFHTVTYADRWGRAWAIESEPRTLQAFRRNS